jgi:hypothetical protein
MHTRTQLPHTHPPALTQHTTQHTHTHTHTHQRDRRGAGPNPENPRQRLRDPQNPAAAALLRGRLHRVGALHPHPRYCPSVGGVGGFVGRGGWMWIWVGGYGYQRARERARVRERENEAGRGQRAVCGGKVGGESRGSICTLSLRIRGQPPVGHSQAPHG